MAEPPVVTFGQLLRQLRTEAGLTQEELAAAARLSARTVSDLERGTAPTARKDTARRLADALALAGPLWESFQAVARGRAPGGAFPQAGTVGGVAAATRTLPRDVASFTGREPQLRQLADAAAGVAASGGVVGIHAIGGLAGVGKTAFAVHAAHQLAAWFPDGQIFLPLHGHTPGQRPVDPADALASLLLTAGVSAGQVPPGLEARMALWRDRLAGRQVLLLFDDAADSEQVRPLLPGMGQSLVLVTSRRHLTALDDAQAISLDTLAPAEASRLLVQLAARPGLETGDPAVAEITRLCGYLPLAVGMLARQLHHHPAWTVADLAADLAEARDRLELMHAETLSVAAALGLSYADLTQGQQRLFRRLGLHPGADIDAYAAAALDGTSLGAARRNLDALYDQYLLAEPARGRYRLHDLVREHARTLAALEQPAERDAATGRLFDYYQHTAAIAEARLARLTRPLPSPAAPPAVVPGLPDRPAALAWARAERANLLACLDHATRADQRSRVVGLTAGLAALLLLDGPWSAAITGHATAAHAAHRLGDRPGEARALGTLGNFKALTGDLSGALEAQQAALSIYRDLGDRQGQANTLTPLGDVRYAAGDYPGAAQALEQALPIYRDLGDRPGEANALTILGYGRRLAGDFPGATQALQEALVLYRDLGDRRGQADALTELGDLRRQAGDYPQAGQALQEALGLYRDVGDRRDRANALAGLGDIRRHVGDFPGADRALREALDIYRDFGDPQGQANALLYLGSVRRLTGDYPGAAQALAEALGRYRDLGVRRSQAEALNETGTLHRVRGDLDSATSCHRQALALAREIDSHWDEAHALAGLGRCALAAGDTTGARTSLRQALKIFQPMGAAEATSVATELDAIADAETTRDNGRSAAP